MKDRLCRFSLDVPRWIRRYVYPHKSIDKLTDLLALFPSLAGYVLRKFHIKLHTEEHSARSTDYSLIRKPSDGSKLNQVFRRSSLNNNKWQFRLKASDNFPYYANPRQVEEDESKKCVISWNPRILISRDERRKLLITKLGVENVFFFPLPLLVTFERINFSPCEIHGLCFSRENWISRLRNCFTKLQRKFSAKFRNLMRNQTGSF